MSHETTEGPTRTNRRRFWLAAVAAAALGAALAATLAPGDDARAFGRRHWGGHHGSADPEAMRERADFMTERVLRWVDATDEQEGQIKAIVAASLDEMLTLREGHDATREALVEILGATEVDRQALEALRAAELVRAEQASVILTRSFADAADVLTPEQRAELIETARMFHHR